MVDADAPLPADSQRRAPDVRERWNDYGIGLLLQGDIKGAEAAFLRVTEMEPGYADGWVNVGRARLQEGNVSGAEEVLRRALEIDPDLAKSHFFLGMALKALGRYDEALVHLREAAARYPRDRVVLNQTGRVLFLKRQYREALTEFRRVLAIDPEDLQAHYNLMLAYQGLGDPAAAQERVLYERLKADESAQSITGPYRRLHPDDNNERQSIHEHGPPLEPAGAAIVSVGTNGRDRWRGGLRRRRAARHPNRRLRTMNVRRMDPCGRRSMSGATGHVAAPIAVLAAAAIGLSAQSPGTARGDITFRDVTARAGITFKHENGAFGKKYLPETMGSGCAFVDIDNDGWLDIVFVNSTTWPGQKKGSPSWPAIYRNRGDGTFVDVTRAAGLATEFYGLGVAAGDYDNDGWTDLYFTTLGANRLYRNTGKGAFVDVTAKAAVADPGFSTSAAWFDFDRDGQLDLYVANYVEWTIETDLTCTLDGKTKSYCTPESYKGQSGRLYRNRGDGTFEDVTRRAGLFDATSKALGVALLDFDEDGHLDLFVANDTQPNRLWRSRGDGTFIDVAVQAGVAFNEAGVARAGMGVDAADYDGSGRESLIIGNFSNEMMALYTNEGNGLFIDEAPASAIGRTTLLTLTFGCFFFDYDLDGLVDIFAANGHVADDIARVQPRVTYAQAPHLFRNLGARKFVAATADVGPDFAQPIVGRGAAYGDYDNDGDLDVLVTTNGGKARLFRNDGGNRQRAIRVLLRGVQSTRDGIGAKVTAVTEGRRSRTLLVRTGSSYLSQSERAVTFGLGQGGPPASLRVVWPSGRTDTITTPQVNRLLTVEEGRGVVGERRFETPAALKSRDSARQ